MIVFTVTQLECRRAERFSFCHGWLVAFATKEVLAKLNHQLRYAIQFDLPLTDNYRWRPATNSAPDIPIIPSLH